MFFKNNHFKKMSSKSFAQSASMVRELHKYFGIFRKGIILEKNYFKVSII